MAPIRLSIVWLVCSLSLIAQHFALGAKQKLCGNKSLWITRVGHLRPRAISTQGCPDEIVKLYEDVLKMANDNLIAKYGLCSMESIDHITQLFKTHGLRKRGAAEVDESAAGSAEHESGAYAKDQLTKFAIAYGMITSDRCKTFMFKQFASGDWLAYLPTLHHNALMKFIGDGTPTSRLVGSLTTSTEFLVATDIDQVFPGFENNYLAHLNGHDNKDLYVVQKVCSSLRPYYERFMLTIAQLAKDGFDFVSVEFLLRMGAMSRDNKKMMRFWSRVVFLCESALKMEQVKLDAEDLPPRVDFYITNAIHTKRPPGFYDDDVVWDIFDIRLNLAIKNYDPTLSSEERMRARLLEHKSKILLAAFDSNDKTTDMLRKSIESWSNMVAGKPDAELESLKKELLHLLESGEHSKFVETISKVLDGGRFGAITACKFTKDAVCLTSWVVFKVFEAWLEAMGELLSTNRKT